MTRDEWNAYAESVPLTPDQRGRIMHECERLGLVDRAERLWVLATLLDLDELESIKELTLGQAGRLVNLLQHARARAELPGAAPVAGEHQDDEPDGGNDGRPPAPPAMSLGEALKRFAVALWLIFGEPGSTEGDSSGD